MGDLAKELEALLSYESISLPGRRTLNFLIKEAKRQAYIKGAEAMAEKLDKDTLDWINKVIKSGQETSHDHYVRGKIQTLTQSALQSIKENQLNKDKP